MIVTGGGKCIIACEVEPLFLNQPAGGQVAVFVLPDRSGGEIVADVFRSKPGMQPL